MKIQSTLSTFLVVALLTLATGCTGQLTGPEPAPAAPQLEEQSVTSGCDAPHNTGEDDDGDCDAPRNTGELQ